MTSAEKTFAYFKAGDPEKWRFSMRVAPVRFLEITDMPGIKPARYRGRYHWVSLVKVESMSNDYLIELVEWSCQKACSFPTCKKQNGIADRTQ